MGPLSVKSLTLWALTLVIISANQEDYCPHKCTCRRANSREDSFFLKLKCGGGSTIIYSFEEVDLLNIASNIAYLNLSNNQLTTFYLKVQLISVQKLDLSKNRLTELEVNQFSELPNLRRLDISNNYIKTIEQGAFAKLIHLERLKLNQNKITTILFGTFNGLENFKQLDISNNPLNCDCGLLWLLDWTQKHSVKLLSNPTCSSPYSLKGPLRKLRVGVDIHCKSPLLNQGYPLISLKPSSNQVVFEGDSLKLECIAPSLSDTVVDTKIEWAWLDSDPQLFFDDISIENEYFHSKGKVFSSLKIGKLKRNHTGIWNCVFLSLQGNFSRGITIVVISEDTEYCPIAMTENNKGTYTWPRTVVNYTATIPCESENVNYDISAQKASYFCTSEGNWENLNTSMCAFISESTKILEQFSKVNSSMVESAKHFRNYTSNLHHFHDVMDLVFAVETIENYLVYVGVEQMGGLLIDVSNNLLQLPKSYWWKSNVQFHVCQRLINILERIAATNSPSLGGHKSRVSSEVFPLKKVGFLGLKCTWYTNRPFACISNGQIDETLPDKTIIASIVIPETLFFQLKAQNILLNENIYNILVAMHTSSKLFPITATEANEEIRTVIVGAKLVNMTVTNLTDPIFITLKIPPPTYSETTPLVPVWNNNGTWSTSNCFFSHEYSEHTVFYCHSFGYYALKQDMGQLQTTIGAKFKLCHPAIYVGSFILFVSFLIEIITYLMGYSSIQMPKKAKHSLINLWISVCCLCFMYVFGIYQTEHVRICQIVGMLLHYFTLTTLLWMCVGVNCMYKRLSKNDIMGLQDDELPSDQPIKKPILGLYFVGWGVAVIVCGISAAINIRDYMSGEYCFLRSGPPISALYLPFVILVLFLIVFFLLIRCTISGIDATGHLSECTQGTENVDLDLLEPNFPENRSVFTGSSKTASSEAEDIEHSPSAQLKAHIIFVILYIMCWLSCASATVLPYGFVTFETDLFSVAFALLATALSAFTLFFYCVARSDVRELWVDLMRRARGRKPCLRTRNVSDTTQNLSHIQVQPLPIPPVTNSLELQIASRSSSRSSGRQKSHNSNILKGAVDLNSVQYSSDGAKINNVNLVVLHRQQYRDSVIPNIIENPTNAAEVFYNPHQSIVARKFFKRQKRHMLKRNNLVPHPRDSDSTSVISNKLKSNSNMDRSMFGTNSKVNNTNIHVEHVHTKHQKNPNIFSDSAEDCEQDVPVQNIVLNAERLRRRELSKHRTRKKSNQPESMRSVSQQCTLEYSSENISDSILDNKTSPDKTSPLKIYVNPSHGFVEKTGPSSDLDEIYQQIRHGPNNPSNSPCLSESDITSYVNNRTENEDVETTV